MESLALYFRTRGEGAETVVGADPSALDHHLSVAENFLKWALDSDNRGGARTLTLEELSAQRAHLEEVFRSLRTGTRPCQRIRPLSEQEVASLRRVLTPKAESGGDWVFPKGVFYRHAQLRNWLMVEIALELGLRRGELLKLRLDSLPRGSDDGLRVLRRPDDPHDSQQREPAVKTAERVVPVSRSLLSLFRAYLISAPPLGRVTGKTPYLFVTGGGAPLWVKASDDIIRTISRHSGITLKRLRDRACGIARPWALMSDLVAPLQGLAVEVLQSQEGTGREEIGTDVLNGPFDAPFLVPSGRATRTCGEMIVRGELQEARVEVDGITATLEHHTAEIIGRQVPGGAAPIVKGMNVAEEEILERLVQKEFEPQGPAVREGEDKAGQAAAGVPDGDFAEMG